MTTEILGRLLAIFVTVALGWVAARARWLGDPAGGGTPARVLSAAAFNLFVPALLFRTTARLDLAALPWRTIAAYFLPVCAYLLAVYAWQRRAIARHGAAAAAARAISATYGNAVQLGIPLAAALFGEAGLGIHIALVSVHALLLLTLLTVLVELDLARVDHRSTLASTVRATVRNTLVHPVVLPVVAGLAWNLTGIGLPGIPDQVLAALGSAVVPVCLVLIGVSLQAYGVRGQWQDAVRLAALKLLLLPALVFASARWGFGLSGVPLAVLVTMAALPVGSNALIFAQRYRTLEGEATLAIVISTVAFVATVSAWLALLTLVP
jgi:hypothetical protein